MSPAEVPDTVFDRVARVTEERLRRNRQVRRNLPGPGRLYVERTLPFLCVYRAPAERQDRGTVRLVTATSSYLASLDGVGCREGLRRVADAMTTSILSEIGGCLVLEIWSAAQPRIAQPIGFTATGIRFRAPSFRLHVRDRAAAPETVDALVRALGGIRLGPPGGGGPPGADVEVVEGVDPFPPGLHPLISPDADGSGGGAGDGGEARWRRGERGAVPADEPGEVAADEPRPGATEEPGAVLTDEPGMVPADEPGKVAAEDPRAVAADEPGAVATDDAGAVVESAAVVEGVGGRGGAVGPGGGRRQRAGTPARASGARAVCIGIEVDPIYRHSTSGALFPETLRLLRRGMSLALQEAAHVFARHHTTLRPRHAHALGRRKVGRTAHNVDRALAEVANAYDFLLSVTPVNADQAWNDFRAARFEMKPRLLYRPLPFDPQQLKRRLFRVRIERVEDTSIGDLFREKQNELDQEISMLQELGTQAFFYGSLRRYGGVDEPLLQLALSLLRRFPRKEEPGREEYVEQRAASRRHYVGADEFRRHALAEIDRYAQADPGFAAEVEIRSDMVAGLMVSGGRLLVNRALRTPRSRVAALLHHEVGTHLLTLHNGRRQPFRQLAAGLARYEVLQEGLAVFSEYVGGGLTGSRARVLAGRVLAVDARARGATFVEAFRELHRKHDFRPKAAFLTVLRAFRGGGFTKDAVYLKGIRDLLTHLGRGGALEPLFVGKIALEHLELVEELRLREVFAPPALLPRYLRDPQSLERLEAGRKMNVFDLARAGER